MHVEVHNLVRRYGWKTALNGVTFTLNSGGITAFVGAPFFLWMLKGGEIRGG